MHYVKDDYFLHQLASCCSFYELQKLLADVSSSSQDGCDLRKAADDTMAALDSLANAVEREQVGGLLYKQNLLFIAARRRYTYTPRIRTSAFLATYCHS